MHAYGECKMLHHVFLWITSDRCKQLEWDNESVMLGFYRYLFIQISESSCELIRVYAIESLMS